MEQKYYQEYEEALQVAANNPNNAKNYSIIGGVIEARDGIIVDFNALETLLDEYFVRTYGTETKYEPTYKKYKEKLW